MRSQSLRLAFRQLGVDPAGLVGSGAVAIVTETHPIRGERIAAGLSQAQLAGLLEVGQATLSQWELGRQGLPDGREAEIRDLLSRVEELIDQGRVPRKKRYVRRRYRRKRRVPGLVESARAADWAAQARIRKYPDGSYADGLSRFEIPKTKRLSGVALFAGCGGMSLGFQWAGIDVLGFSELDDAARASYRASFPHASELAADVHHVTPEGLRSAGIPLGGEVDVLFGGPPCQGFSLTGKRDRHDPRNGLFREFVRIAECLRPRALVVENVRLLTSMRSPAGRLLPYEIAKAFDGAGYSCHTVLVDASHFGVPQVRQRVVFLGFRRDVSSTDSLLAVQALEQPASESPVTFGDATGDLRLLESGDCDPDDPYHWSVSHPEHVTRWLADVPEGASAHENDDPALRPPSGYNTTYKRLRWDEPGATIATTFGMISASRTVHPRATRSLTPREAMRIQSMPDAFMPLGKWGDIRRMIGNAVPPLLAYRVASSVAEALD